MEKDSKRINAGYEIIKSVPVGNTEFVLGQSIYNGAQYVTWECTGGNNYFWGHYFATKEIAIADLYNRVEREVQFQRDENVVRNKSDIDREER